MDQASQAWQASSSTACALSAGDSGQTSSMTSPADTATPKADNNSGQKEGLLLCDRKVRLSTYDCRPMAAMEAGYTYDYLLNLCMPRDHQPLPGCIVELITGQNMRYRMQLAEDLESCLQCAQEYANRGDKTMLRCYVGRAKGIAKELDINISTLIPTISPQKHLEYLHGALEDSLKLSGQCADQGNRNGMSHNLQRAHRIANHLGLDISARVPVIRREKEQAYLRAELERELEAARRSAENGDKYGMELCITQAQRIAVLLNIDISQRVPAISPEKVSVYLSRQLEKDLKLARGYAHEGNKDAMELAQDSARTIAVQLGVDISQRVDEISMDFHHKFGVISRL